MPVCTGSLHKLTDALPVLLLLPLVLLVGQLAMPTSLVNRYRQTYRAAVTGGIAVLLLCSVLLAVGWMLNTRRPMVFEARLPPGGLVLGLYIDGMASLMLGLVALVATVVSRFSERYLDGEVAQGSYFKWLAVTVGSVATMIVSASLLQFFLFWVLTSAGLHRLLLHYPQRLAAQRAAWHKFAINRLGDVGWLVALWLVFQEYGTFAFSELFSLAGKGGAESSSWNGAMIAWCLMWIAVTKSAQFPFHTWLPNTMETPTPVSALMHAGIVNGGGYLLIRTNCLFSQSASAMAALTMIGLLTACYGSVVMMTQSSIKRSLAYSTIAQMGFMLLQCGLGAFSAAMLHIVAHSLYKAYAFLMSGSLIAVAGRSRAGETTTVRPARLLQLVVVGGAVVLIYGAVQWMVGLNLVGKPGGLALTVMMGVAFMTWSWQLTDCSRASNMMRLFAAVLGLSSVYALSYLAMDSWMKPGLPSIAASPYAVQLFALVVLAFIGLFCLQVLIQRRADSDWLFALRVHAMNGFYVDAWIERWWLFIRHPIVRGS
jgi:NAD(P)H-quinone oxidoreductase subunit 5